MKNKSWIILGVLIFILLFWLIWRLPGAQQKVSWETVPIERGDLKMLVSASGTLGAINTVEVGTQVSGVIQEILVDYNDQVKKDQVIAKLDIRNLKAALDQANAALLQANVQLAQKKRAYTLASKFNADQAADLSVLEAEASLQQLKAQLDQAERNYNRYKELFHQGVVAAIEYEARLTDYQQLEANYTSRLAALQRTKANVGNVDIQRSLEEVQLAEANVAAMQAAKNKARINLDFAYIRAPIDGIVISRDIEVGQTVAASFQTPVLFTIANDLTKMEIEASIDEADIGFIEIGQAVDFTVDAYLDQRFSGQVAQIRLKPQVISNVVTYTAIINASNEDLKLMPGMTANLDITTAQRHDVLKAPVSALNFSPPPAFAAAWEDEIRQKGISVQTSDQQSWKAGVLWILEDDRPTPKKVKTGLSDGYFTELLSTGFQEGDLVIVGMSSQAKPGKGGQQASPFMPSRRRARE